MLSILSQTQVRELELRRLPLFLSESDLSLPSVERLIFDKFEYKTEGDEWHRTVLNDFPTI
ncbi:hypothetical protein JCM10296v2_005423 [Rhodotorula toruloides]